MNIFQINKTRATLARFIDLQAEETISEEAKWRVLEPVLKRIASGEFSRRYYINKQTTEIAMLSGKTKSGKVAINIVINKQKSNTSETENNQRGSIWEA